MASITLNLGECTGMENECNKMQFIDELLPTSNKDDPQEIKPKKKLCSKKKTPLKKEFPPPIPLLAQTENLRSHMPWVLRRHYTSDGRLVLYKEKVRHHEYFKIHREDGRLTLQLVPIDIDCIPGYLSDFDHEGDEEEDNTGDDAEEFGDENEKEEDYANEDENVYVLKESIKMISFSKSDSSQESAVSVGGF